MKPLLHALVLLVPAVPKVLAADAVPGRERLQPPRTTAASPLTDRFALTLGYGLEDGSLRMRVDGDYAGTALDAVTDLGVPRQRDVLQAELAFRFGQFSRLRIDYVAVQRDATRVLARELVIDDERWSAGGTVHTRAGLRSLGFDYSRAMHQDERGELSLSAGLRLSEGEALVESADLQRARAVEGVLPVPTLGLDGTWLPRERWSVNARVQYIAGRRGQVQAALARLQADVQYRWHDNLAVGLGVTRLDIDATSARPGDSGRLRAAGTTAALFLRAAF
ncbi:MAG: hypothetical protein RL026_2376 [Pseudomonadota bacterium]